MFDSHSLAFSLLIDFLDSPPALPLSGSVLLMDKWMESYWIGPGLYVLLAELDQFIQDEMV
jgi:hypothetical protein